MKVWTWSEKWNYSDFQEYQIRVLYRDYKNTINEKKTALGTRVIAVNALVIQAWGPVLRNSLLAAGTEQQGIH